MIYFKVIKTLLSYGLVICTHLALFVNCLSRDHPINSTNLAEDLTEEYSGTGSTLARDVYKEPFLVLYTTHYDILEARIDHNFTEQIDSKVIKSNLSDPTEVYYSLASNYLIYEMIGSLYVQTLDANKSVDIGLSSNKRLPNSLKSNSQLNVDWIHNLLYWVKDKKQILVSHPTQAHRPVVLANKIYDYITCLAVNPIDSLVVWIEFDSEFNEYILYKTFLDGSDRESIYTMQSHVKRLEFDFQSKRLYYLTSFELISISYYGTDRQVVVSESHSIFQFEVINDILFWIEYNSNQLFRSQSNDFKSNQKVLDFNHMINRFKIVDKWRQPEGVNRCLRSNCSDLCLPVDRDYFKCVCHIEKTCNDNQDLQLIFNHHSLIRTSTLRKTRTPSPTTSKPMTSTETEIKINTTSDKITLDPIERIDSISFNDRNINQRSRDPRKHVFFTISGPQSNETLVSKPELISNETTTTITKEEKVSQREGSVHIELDDRFFHSGTSSTTEESVVTESNSDKNQSNTSDNHSITTTNKISKLSTIFAITSTELTIEENNGTDKDLMDTSVGYEVKEYDYQYIPQYLYKPLTYGFIILVTGLVIGTLLSSIAIRIYGRHKCKSTYNTNFGTTNKWDSVGFRKAEQNIYFGAKYTVKDESLY